MLSHFFVFVMMATLPAVAGPPPAWAVDITGRWVMTLETPQGQSSPRLNLRQDGQKLTGTYTGRYESAKLSGTVVGRAVQFAFTILVEGQPVELSFTGEVDEGSSAMKGDAQLGPLGRSPWSAKRDTGGGVERSR